MRKIFSMVGAFAFVLSISSLGHAQALPTATSKGTFQIGGGFTYAKTDYGPKPIKGLSGFADFDFGLHFGVEADVHYVALVTPNDLAENTYLVGPRAIVPFGRFQLYAKALMGYGDLVIQEEQDNVGNQGGYFFAYAIGGGLDIRATKRITIRAIDLEAQQWPHYQTGLTPTVITVGAAYRFH